MAFNFTDDQGYDQGEPDPVQDVVDHYTEEYAVQAEEDQQLSEVEARLEVASYYRLLLNDHLFGTMTPAATQVEREIRTFIKERLEILVGLRQEQAPARDIFTTEETAALKTIAAKVLKKPELVQDTPTPKAPPSLNKVNPGNAPVAKQTLPAKPQVKKAGVAPVSAQAPVPRGKGKARKQFKTVNHPTTGQPIRIDVTPTATSETHKPLPTLPKAQFEQVMRQQAQQQVTTLGQNPMAGALAAKLATGE